MRVILLPNVLDYLENISEILYEKEYFSFELTSRKYVVELYDDIVANLPVKLHKPAPKYFDKYGNDLYYAVFKKNKRTAWYAFFSKYNDNGQTVYLVCYIGNNHTCAQHL